MSHVFYAPNLNFIGRWGTAGQNPKIRICNTFTHEKILMVYPRIALVRGQGFGTGCGYLRNGSMIRGSVLEQEMGEIRQGADAGRQHLYLFDERS